MTVAKAGLKLAVLVVAMLAAIGAWEVYKGTVKVRGEAYAQGGTPFEREVITILGELRLAVVDGGDGFPRLHFKCYGITPGGPSLNQPVTVFDQFFPPEGTEIPPEGGDDLTVRAKHHLCTPALKVLRSNGRGNNG